MVCAVHDEGSMPVSIFIAEARNKIPALIAAAEALRERVAELENQLFSSEKFRREDAAEEIEGLGRALKRAEAAEASNKEMREILTVLLKEAEGLALQVSMEFCISAEETDQVINSEPIKKARAALKAKP